MTHNANALRAFMDSFVFPVPIYREEPCSEEIVEYCERVRLLRYIREGLVTGHGTRNRVKRIRFVAGTREIIQRLRIVKPDDAAHIPVVGDVVLLYKDNRRKYRRSGIPRAFGPVVTKLSGGRTCEETVTEI